MEHFIERRATKGISNNDIQNNRFLPP